MIYEIYNIPGRVAIHFATRPKAFNPSRRDTTTAPMGRFHPAKGRISHAAGVFHLSKEQISLELLYFATAPIFYPNSTG